MKSINSIYSFYLDGFKNMKLGRTLWKIVFIKLALILLLVNLFIYNKSLQSEYTTSDEKADFVYKNLVGEK